MTGRVRSAAACTLVSLAVAASSAPALGAEPGGGGDPAAELQAEYPLNDGGGAPEPEGPAALESRSGAITVDGGGGPSPVVWLLLALAFGLSVVALSQVLPLPTRPLRAPALSSGPSATRPPRRTARKPRGPRPKRARRPRPKSAPDPQPKPARDPKAKRPDPQPKPARDPKPKPARDPKPKRPDPQPKPARDPKAKRPDPGPPRRPRVVPAKLIRLGGPLLRYSAEDDAVVLRGVGNRFGPALRPERWLRLTIHEFAFLDRERSREIGIADREHGVLLATDERGRRWTLFARPESVRAMVTAPPYGQVEGTEVDGSEFPDRREGWLDELGPSAEA